MSIRAFARNEIVFVAFLLYGCGNGFSGDSPALKPAAPLLKQHAAARSHLSSTALPITKEAPGYSPGDYLLHLSLADLKLQGDRPDIAVAAGDLDLARAYCLQAQPKSVLQPVIITEYSLQDGAPHKFVIIPFSMSQENGAFPGLEESVSKLNDLSYTLYDVKLAVVNLPPQEAMELKENIADARLAAESRLAPLIAKAVSLPPMAQTRIYLQLARFFMRHQFREPAYLAIENARQSLASVNADGSAGAANSTRNLSREIDAQETLLHTTMPFMLNSL